MANRITDQQTHPASGLSHYRQEAILRKRVTRFLLRDFKRDWPLTHVMKEIVTRGWTAYLFGGLLRDLMAFDSRSYRGRPRDIDIVVDGIAIERILGAFSRYVHRRTRFGGLHLSIDGWLFDIWPLNETWAFREQLVPRADIVHLPGTTFLDVEAVVYNPGHFYERQGIESRFDAWDTGTRQIYSAGFFQAMHRKQIDINLRENPYPALCIVRSLITAKRLAFTVGPRLALYISQEARRIDFHELLSIQVSHYGRIVLQSEALRKLIAEIEVSIHKHPDQEVNLFFTKPQLRFPMDDAAVCR